MSNYGPITIVIDILIKNRMTHFIEVGRKKSSIISVTSDILDYV